MKALSSFRFLRRIAVPVLSAAGFLFLVASLFLSGCSPEPTPPGATNDPESRFEATLDPGNSSFLLARVSSRPDLAIELVGSNLVTDSRQETVSLDVAIRNVSERELPGPAEVWLMRFRPEGVEVLNADLLDPVPEESGALPQRFGFDYSAAFGADDVLAPNETSLSRTWSFRVPGSTSFSFSAVANFGFATDALLGGSVFHDLDGDGTRDADEPPFSGRIVVMRPDGSRVSANALDEGRYAVPVRDVGLHLVTYEPPEVDCPCDIVVTTPNPLEVVIVPNGSGEPQDYLGADFGARILHHGEAAPIVLTDLPPEEIRQDPYRVAGEIELHGDILSMLVAFGGCTPEHDFTLYMTGGFMESNPVQVRLVLGHDDFDEPCDAAFERRLRFDLRPLREAYERVYGQPGPVRLRFRDLENHEYEFRYAWGPPVGESLLRNGSFELNGQPTFEGWELVNPDLATLVPGGAPASGEWALRLAADWAPTTGIARAVVPGVANGERIQLLAWIRAEEEGGGGRVYLTSGRWASEAVTVESTEWTPVRLVSEVQIARGDSLWVVLSSLHTEIAPRVGLFDGVIVER